ncbi:hypothetical protein [Acinetobacter phage HFM1]|nr:hypothetical protein [Acinetobacter phage HFM1]
MKKLLAALLLMPSLASAGFCDAVYDFAEATMLMRQTGYSKHQAKEVVEEMRSVDNTLANLMDANVDWAYSFHVYKGEDKEAIASNFANDSYQICKDEEKRATDIKEFH